MKQSRDPVRGDLAHLGPTLFVQEYRRRGWSDGRIAGVMAGAGVSAGKIHEVLSYGRERIDLAHLGPMNFVQEYRRRGWSDGNLAGVMAGEGVSAGKIHHALSQPKTESGASRAWRTLEKASDTTTRVIQDVGKLGTAESPLRAGSAGERRKPDYGRVFLKQEAEDLRERSLPPEKQEALILQRAEQGAKLPKIPMGTRPSAAKQAIAVAEQLGLGVLGGASDVAWDTMAQLEAVRAPMVRLRIQQLRKKGGAEANAEADFLEQSLPGNIRKAGKLAKSGINRFADSRLTPNRVSAQTRICAQMGRGVTSDVLVPMAARKYLPSLTPGALAGRPLERYLRSASWMQPLLRRAKQRGLDEDLIKTMSGAGIGIAKQIAEGEPDPAKAIEKALESEAKRKAFKAARTLLPGAQ